MTKILANGLVTYSKKKIVYFDDGAFKTRDLASGEAVSAVLPAQNIVVITTTDKDMGIYSVSDSFKRLGSRPK